MLLVRRVGSALLTGAVCVALIACSDGGARPMPAAMNIDTDAGLPPAPPPPVGCTEGEVAACTVTLPPHNGVKGCFRGQHVCRDGEWSDCLAPEALPGPSEVSEQIAEASCPAGTTAHWRWISWEALTPSDAKGRSGVKLSLQSATSIDGPAFPTKPVVIVDTLRGGDPAKCVGSCAKPIVDALGDASRAPVLKIQVKLSASANGQQKATIQSIVPTFACE